MYKISIDNKIKTLQQLIKSSENILKMNEEKFSEVLNLLIRKDKEKLNKLIKLKEKKQNE